MTAALITINPLSLVAGPWAGPPARIEILPGLRVDGALTGWTDGVNLLVDVVYANQAPTEFHTLATTSYSLSGSTLTVTRTWTAPTLAAVKTALKARLNNDATGQWIACRGSKTALIETANTNGAAAIDAALTIAAAISAYQAVVWP